MMIHIYIVFLCIMSDLRGLHMIYICMIYSCIMSVLGGIGALSGHAADVSRLDICVLTY
jgi:hypothetical protein